MILKYIKIFLRNETGAETLEYVAITGFIIVAAMLAYQPAVITNMVLTALTGINTSING